MYCMKSNEQRIAYTDSVKPVHVRRRFPDRAENALMDISMRFNVSDMDIVGKSRLRPTVKARQEFLRTLHFKFGYSFSYIAHLMQLDLTSVLHHLGMRKTSKVKYDHLKSVYQ